MIINSIDTRDISFVVQGAVDKINTKLCLESIRKNFPGSIIILSTWEKTDVSDLNYDKVVFCQDPGGAIYDIGEHCNNINRQLVSSYEGLKAVSTRYAAKVRSDLIFEGPNFLWFFNQFMSYREEYKLVKSRLIVLSMYSRQFADIYAGVKLQNYHPSDWFCFGHTEDVIRYFSPPIIPDISCFSNYFLDFPDRSELPYPYSFFQNSPEQYLGAKFRGLDVNKENIITLSDSNLQMDSLQFMVNNFVILDYKYSKIYSGKWEALSKDEFNCPTTAIGLFFYGDFLRLYQRYCDQSFVIPGNIDKEILKRKLNVAKELLWRNKIREYRRKFILKVKSRFSFVKKLLRWIFPAYRVGYGTRDILLHMQEEERGSLNYLHFKVDQLSSALDEKSKEIKKLSKQLEALKGQDDDQGN